MSGWPRLTVCPVSTKRSRTFPGTRNPRSLCTRAETIPVNERSACIEVATVPTRTNGGWVRGSVEGVASLHAAKRKGSKTVPTALNAFIYFLVPKVWLRSEAPKLQGRRNSGPCECPRRPSRPVQICAAIELDPQRRPPCIEVLGEPRWPLSAPRRPRRSVRRQWPSASLVSRPRPTESHGTHRALRPAPESWRRTASSCMRDR